MTSQKKSQNHKSPYWRPDKPLNVRETERVEQMCVWLMEHRLLSFDQWVRLLNRSEPTVKALLKKLYRGYYFDRIEYPTMGTGRNQAIYRLDVKGVKFLEKLGYQVVGIPSKSVSAFVTIPHTLAIADVRIAITQGIDALGWDLVEWVGEYDFFQEYDSVTLPGQRKKRALKPDSFFVVQLPNKRVSAFFLEVDRASENLKTFTDKIKSYVQYHKSGQFTKRYNYKGFRVLTVVDDLARRRLANLEREVGKIEGVQRRYWLTHKDDIAQSNPLTAPIWTIASDERGAQLFES